MYDFKNLSPTDFEDLARDLIGHDLNVRFEAFMLGPDGGMDGRHSRAGSTTVLQVKHLVGSTFPGLKSKMKKERASIDKLKPDRYILVTSQKLTDGRKKELAAIIGPSLKNLGDIYSADDLNGRLRAFPSVEKAHIKLWLSSTAVLEMIVNATAATYAKYTLEEIHEKVRVYAVNPSLEQGQAKLEQYHVLIVSGPPGVGKTTLAEMLTYAYLSKGWEFVAIKDLDSGYPDIDDTKRQIIFFDDFLGTIGLDAASLSNNDSELARFLKRVRKSVNARFVLTTRAYVLEAAKEISEHIADKSVDVTKYLLDVGLYTRRIKAKILYNHLSEAKTPPEYIRALISANSLPQIIDHKNYNPRIVDWMTDALRIQDNDIPAPDYPKIFLNTLDNPSELWDKAFRTHIDERCRHLLYCVFFSNQYGVEIADLRAAYDEVHKAFSLKFGSTTGPKDFEESLKILEGSFISLRGTAVNFVNPSVRDYLNAYLNDPTLLSDFALCAHRVTWARVVWEKIKGLLPGGGDHEVVANAFLPIAKKFNTLPIYRIVDTDPIRWGTSDVSISGRLQFLLELWEITNVSAFADLALDLLSNPIERFTAWSDGYALVTLIGKIKSGDWANVPSRETLMNQLYHVVEAILERDIDLDDLDTMSEIIFKNKDSLTQTILSKVEKAIHFQFDNIDNLASSIESSSTGDDYVTYLNSLGERANLPYSKVEPALDKIRNRIASISDETEEADDPEIKVPDTVVADTFDDLEMHNLFATLVGEDVPPYVEYMPEIPF